jgi:hypothetical protein
MLLLWILDRRRCEVGIDSRCRRLSDRNSPTPVAEAEEGVEEEVVVAVVDSKRKSRRSANAACGRGKRAIRKHCPS